MNTGTGKGSVENHSFPSLCNKTNLGLHCNSLFIRLNNMNGHSRALRVLYKYMYEKQNISHKYNAATGLSL